MVIVNLIRNLVRNGVRRTACMLITSAAATGAAAQAQDQSPTVSMATPIAVQARFTTPVLPGGAPIEAIMKLPSTASVRWPPKGIIQWLPLKNSYENLPEEPQTLTQLDCQQGLDRGSKTLSEGSNKDRLVFLSMSGQGSPETIFTVQVPEPPRQWPPWQQARIEISACAASSDRGAVVQQMFFTNTTSISVIWFPVAAALATVAVVYPGCALLIWHLRRRRYKAKIKENIRKGLGKTLKDPEPAGFWETLDPVQLTAGALGRASLSKLQIFAFSLIVFGLLLYFQFRHGLLVGLSKDILYLLGISAAGAVGGKIAGITKQRLNLDNWVWLQHKGWLAERDDIAPRARWSDLFVTESQEFDVYSFQMAIFSLIVGVALLTTNLPAFAEFKIPIDLLILLGISQGVYISGKVAEQSPRAEFNEKITEVRNLEKDCQATLATLATAEAKGTKCKAFNEALEQAARMFKVVYGKDVPSDQIQKIDYQAASTTG